MASANAFDFKLFKRLLEFTKPYRLVFYFVAFTALILSGLAILRPYFLERAIDESIIPRDPSGLIYFIVIMIGGTGIGSDISILFYFLCQLARPAHHKRLTY